MTNNILIIAALVILLPACSAPGQDAEPKGFVFRDMADAGNDPETPGCHYRWDFSRPPNCGMEQWHQLHSGDSCKSETELYEWVSRECHEPGTPPDRVLIDCKKFCAGTCVVDSRVCPDPRGGPPGDSAHCKCDTPPPPQLMPGS